MTNPYDKMTEEEFDTILEDIVATMNAGEILAINDVNMILREELNNEVLDRWKAEHPQYFES